MVQEIRFCAACGYSGPERELCPRCGARLSASPLRTDLRTRTGLIVFGAAVVVILVGILLLTGVLG